MKQEDKIKFMYLNIVSREYTNSSMMFPLKPVLIHLSDDVHDVSLMERQFSKRCSEEISNLDEMTEIHLTV